MARTVEERAELARRAARLGVVRASELGGRQGGRREGRGWGVSGAPTGPEEAGTRGAETGVGVPVAPAAPVASGAPPRLPPPEAPRREGALLPVAAPLDGLLPDGGLRRGSTVAVGGSAALLLAVLAEVSRAGSWCALIGLPGLGVQAAAEAGLDLSRTALVPRPGPRVAAVTAALVDGVDVVVLGDAAGWQAGDRQRLAARVRQRGAVLVPVVAIPGGWPGADVELRASGGLWAGLAGDGAGRLRTRRVHLRCAARGRAHDRRVDALLPGPGGGCAPAPDGDRAGVGPAPEAPAETG